MKNMLQTHPQCPLCLSHNVTPVSSQTLAFTGAGGLIGGVVAAAVSKDTPDGVSAGPVVAGVLTGAMAGLSVGKEIQKDAPGKPYLCLDCFRTFTNLEKLLKQKGGKVRKTKTGIEQNRIKQEAKQ